MVVVVVVVVVVVGGGGGGGGVVVAAAAVVLFLWWRVSMSLKGQISFSLSHAPLPGSADSKKKCLTSLLNP